MLPLMALFNVPHALLVSISLLTNCHAVLVLLVVLLVRMLTHVLLVLRAFTRMESYVQFVQLVIVLVAQTMYDINFIFRFVQHVIQQVSFSVLPQPLQLLPDVTLALLDVQLVVPQDKTVWLANLDSSYQ